MTYQPKDNTGTLFGNDRKEKETHPDRKGTALIDGVEYYVAGWIKKDKNGNPFLSLAFTRKEDKGEYRQNDRQEPGRYALPAPVRVDDMDSEIPF